MSATYATAILANGVEVYHQISKKYKMRVSDVKWEHKSTPDRKTASINIAAFFFGGGHTVLGSQTKHYLSQRSVLSKVVYISKANCRLNELAKDHTLRSDCALHPDCQAISSFIGTTIGVTCNKAIASTASAPRN